MYKFFEFLYLNREQMLSKLASRIKVVVLLFPAQLQLTMFSTRSVRIVVIMAHIILLQRFYQTFLSNFRCEQMLSKLSFRKKHLSSPFFTVIANNVLYTFCIVVKTHRCFANFYLQFHNFNYE